LPAKIPLSDLLNLLDEETRKASLASSSSPKKVVHFDSAGHSGLFPWGSVQSFLYAHTLLVFSQKRPFPFDKNFGSPHNSGGKPWKVLPPLLVPNFDKEGRHGRSSISIFSISRPSAFNAEIPKRGVLLI